MASPASALVAGERRDHVRDEKGATHVDATERANGTRPRTRSNQKTAGRAVEASDSTVGTPSDQSAVTAELVLSKLRAAGGKLVISGVGEEELAAWRRAAKVAQLRLLRAGRQRLSRWTVGAEMHLRLDLVQASDADDDEFTDEEYEGWLQASTPPPVLPRMAEFLGRRVPVPSSKVTRPHPLVDELTAAAELFDRRWQAQYGPFTRLAAVRRPIVRMRRIWQALITEALFRGYAVHVEQDRRDLYDSGRLVVKIGPDAYDIDLHGDSTTPLRLSIPDDTQRRRRSDDWTDKNGGPIEQRLGDVFTTIERRAERAIEQRAEQERRDAERRRQWKQRWSRPRGDMSKDQRREMIARRMADVDYADDIRAYAQALLVRAAEIGPPRGDSARAWAEWARKHADHIDPRHLKAGMPTIPEPKPEQLKPYLGSFSPYSPY